jgi:hypothetical protein
MQKNRSTFHSCNRLDFSPSAFKKLSGYCDPRKRCDQVIFAIIQAERQWFDVSAASPRGPTGLNPFLNGVDELSRWLETSSSPSSPPPPKQRIQFGKDFLESGGFQFSFLKRLCGMKVN